MPGWPGKRPSLHVSGAQLSVAVKPPLPQLQQSESDTRRADRATSLPVPRPQVTVTGMQRTGFPSLLSPRRCGSRARLRVALHLSTRACLWTRSTPCAVCVYAGAGPHRVCAPGYKPPGATVRRTVTTAPLHCLQDCSHHDDVMVSPGHDGTATGLQADRVTARDSRRRLLQRPIPARSAVCVCVFVCVGG